MSANILLNSFFKVLIFLVFISLLIKRIRDLCFIEKKDPKWVRVWFLFLGLTSVSVGLISFGLQYKTISPIIEGGFVMLVQGIIILLWICQPAIVRTQWGQRAVQKFCKLCSKTDND